MKLAKSAILSVTFTAVLACVVGGSLFLLDRFFAVIDLKREVRIGDIISSISFTVAGVGLFLNWWQLRLGGIRKRAEFIVSVFNQFITDEAASQALYDVEYSRLQYDAQFHESPEERRLDRLLYYFEKIAALYELGTISREDLELVRYEFVRVYRDPAVQQYFETLDGMREYLGVEGGTFQRYRRVAAMLGEGLPLAPTAAAQPFQACNENEAA